MNKTRNKLLILLCLLSLILLCLASCKRAEFSDEEILKAALPLVEEAELLNDIYFGFGIPYTDEGEGAYKLADSEWLAERGITTLEDLKEKTRKVYSQEYCEYLFEIMLGSVRDEGQTASYASYIGTEDGILVFEGRTSYAKGRLEYNPDELKILEKKGEKVRLSIGVSVYNEQGNKQKREKIFDMVKSGECWYLNSTTFLTYNNDEGVPSKSE